MASSCPICADKKFREKFDALIKSGGDLTAAKKLCENELILPGDGKAVSVYRIKQHALEHTGLDVDQVHASFLKTKRRDPAEVAEERKKKEATTAVVNAYLEEVSTIEIDQVLESSSIPLNPRSMSDVLTVAQQSSLKLNLLASAIAVDRLQRFANDPEGRRYPSVELKGAQMTSEMLSTAFGFSNAVNLQTAADTLERAGYEVVERGTNNDKQQLPPSD